MVDQVTQPADIVSSDDKQFAPRINLPPDSTGALHQQDSVSSLSERPDSPAIKLDVASVKTPAKSSKDPGFAKALERGANLRVINKLATERHSRPKP